MSAAAVEFILAESSRRRGGWAVHLAGPLARKAARAVTRAKQRRLLKAYMRVGAYAERLREHLGRLVPCAVLLPGGRPFDVCPGASEREAHVVAAGFARTSASGGPYWVQRAGKVVAGYQRSPFAVHRGRPVRIPAATSAFAEGVGGRARLSQ